jgi:hypothetical protein
VPGHDDDPGRGGSRPQPGLLPAPVAVAAELLDRLAPQLPALTQLGERDRLLVATWLVGLRSPRTRRAYLTDVRAWLDWLNWLVARGIDMLAARGVHVEPQSPPARCWRCPHRRLTLLRSGLGELWAWHLRTSMTCSAHALREQEELSAAVFR